MRINKIIFFSKIFDINGKIFYKNNKYNTLKRKVRTSLRSEKSIKNRMR